MVLLAADANKKQPSKRYKCTFCDRAFSRSEHRSRHERSHTQERPYHCERCPSTFVRRDLLLRHERTVHKRDRIIESPSYRPGLPLPVASGYDNLGPQVHGNVPIAPSMFNSNSSAPRPLGHTFTSYTFSPNGTASNSYSGNSNSNSGHVNGTGNVNGNSNGNGDTNIDAGSNGSHHHNNGALPPGHNHSGHHHHSISQNSNNSANNDYILSSLDIGTNPLSTLASAAGSITAPVDSLPLHLMDPGQHHGNESLGSGDHNTRSHDKRPPLSKINSALPVAVPQLPQGHGYNALLINSHGLRLTNTQLNRYLTIYFTNFHWCLPLLHIPSFDPLHQQSQILAAVCGIGAWLCGETKVAIDLHNVSRSSASNSSSGSSTNGMGFSANGNSGHYNHHNHHHHSSNSGQTSQQQQQQLNNLVSLQTSVLNLIFLIWCRAEHRDAQSYIAHSIHCLNIMTATSPLFTDASDGSDSGGSGVGSVRRMQQQQYAPSGIWQVYEGEKRALYGLYIALAALNSIYGFQTPIPNNELLKLDLDLPCSEKYWTEYQDLSGNSNGGGSSGPAGPPSPEQAPPIPLKFGFVFTKILSNEQVMARVSSFSLHIMGCALLLESSSGINPVLKSKVLTGIVMFDDFYLKEQGSPQQEFHQQQHQQQQQSMYNLGGNLSQSMLCPSPPRGPLDQSPELILGVASGMSQSTGGMKTLYRVMYVSAQLRLCLNDPLFTVRDLLGTCGSSTTYQQHQHQQEINHVLYGSLSSLSAGGFLRSFRVAGLIQDAFQSIFSAPTAMGIEMFRRTMASTPAVVAAVPSIYFVSFELTILIIMWIHIYETSPSSSSAGSTNGNSSNTNDMEDPESGPVYRQIASCCIDSGVAIESQCIAPALADFAADILDSMDLWSLSPIMSSCLRQFGGTLREAVARKPLGSIV